MKDGGLGCYVCDKATPTYMVLDEVWLKAFPNYREVQSELRARWPGKEREHREKRFVSLCLYCLEQRLGRSLLATDFDLGLPINQGILWGALMAWRRPA
jgi:hypothetical protein